MIEVEIRRPERGDRYETIATLRVDDDGTHKITGATKAFPLETPIRHSGYEGGQIKFDEHPQEWARNLGRMLRTAYVYPVVINDDQAPVATA